MTMIKCLETSVQDESEEASEQRRGGEQRQCRWVAPQLRSFALPAAGLRHPFASSIHECLHLELLGSFCSHG